MRLSSVAFAAGLFFLLLSSAASVLVTIKLTPADSNLMSLQFAGLDLLVLAIALKIVLAR